MSKATEALAAIKASPEPIIDAADVAPVLGLHPQSIRTQAAEDPRMLGFNVTRCGQKTLIPRIPFIKWVEGEGV